MKRHLIILLVSLVPAVAIKYPVRYQQEFAGRTITLTEHLTTVEAFGLQLKKGFLHYEP